MLVLWWRASATWRLLVLLGIAAARTNADASCGQAVCSVEAAVVAERLTRSRELTLDASWEYIDQDQPRIGTRRAFVGERPSPEHNEIETVNRTYKLFADYGLTERIAVGLLMPIVHRDHRHEVVDDGEVESWDFSGSVTSSSGVATRYSCLGDRVAIPWRLDWA